jgi:hypothetical protein
MRESFRVVIEAGDAGEDTSGTERKGVETGP